MIWEYINPIVVENENKMSRIYHNPESDYVKTDKPETYLAMINSSNARLLLNTIDNTIQLLWILPGKYIVSIEKYTNKENQVLEHIVI